MISKKVIEKECKRLEKSIDYKQKFLESAPSGNFESHRDRNRWNWYVVESIKNEKGEIHKTRKYISKKDKKLAEKYIKKGIFRNQILDEKQELEALKSYIRKSSNFERVEKFINRNEEFKNLSKSFFEQKWPEDVQSWLNERTNNENFYPEGLRYRCSDGLMVRSKSEQIIATTLSNHNIPFKYENSRILGLSEVHPDFTILSPKDGEEYIWEHFGMMSDSRYSHKSILKIQEYLENGYIPFENFIITFESKNGGIDQFWIEKIIETFFI